MTTILEPSRVTIANSLFDAFAAGDLRQWEARLAPDFSFDYPGMPGGKGAAAARAYNEPFNAAFSDWKTEIHSSATTGDTTFLLMTVHATLSAPLVTPAGTLPATGSRGAVKCVLVSTIRDGKIQHEATYWNVPDLLAQIMPVDA